MRNNPKYAALNENQAYRSLFNNQKFKFFI